MTYNATTSSSSPNELLKGSALRGASFAFQTSPSPSPSSKLPGNTYSGVNGALAAAVRAGTGSTARLKNDLTGESPKLLDTGQQSLAAGREAIRRSPSNAGKSQNDIDYGREESPSRIAAFRAAARSPNKPPVGEIQDGMINNRPNMALPGRDSSSTKDEASIAPAAKLVQLFEAKESSKATPVGKIGRIETSPMATTKPILSPTPIRPPTSSSVIKVVPTSETEQLGSITTSRPLQPKTTSGTSNIKKNPIPPPNQDLPPPLPGRTTTAMPSQSSRSTPPTPPPPRRSTAIALQTPPPATTPLPSLPPRPIPPHKQPSTTPSFAPHISVSSLANAYVASSLASSRAPSPHKPRSPSPPLLPPRLLHRRSLSMLRSSSPRKSQPPHIPMSEKSLRVSPSRSDNGEALEGFGSTSATLPHHHRHPERERHNGGGRLFNKHPHKYAEGDRKRWKSVVEEEERRRYEGVWAANKGGWLMEWEMKRAKRDVPSALASVGAFRVEEGREEATGEEVHALVVEDVWGRSRLEKRLLEEVWELVEGGGREGRRRRGRKLGGTSGGGGGGGEMEKEVEGPRRPWLKRDEFVVGMWLVDQCRKGRKLPVEVGESVWQSVRGLMSGLRAR